VRAGETLGIVGESGSGKTTLALGHHAADFQRRADLFQWHDVQGCSSRDMRALRRDMQIVFQDPYGSLSPRMTVERSSPRGWACMACPPARPRAMVAEVMTEVGLDPTRWTATRTNSPAASASASPSPAR
jgi:microcin C transport system ATP-binding protein